MAGVPFNPLMQPTTAAPPAGTALDPQGIEKLRAMKAQAPGGADMSDAQFALAMHQNHYSDMPLVDFLDKVGLDRGDMLYELRAPGDPYEPAQLAEDAARSALVTHINAIMKEPTTTMAGVVIQAQALEAFSCDPLHAFRPEGWKWPQQFAANLLRIAREAPDQQA